MIIMSDKASNKYSYRKIGKIKKLSKETKDEITELFRPSLSIKLDFKNTDLG